MPFAHAPSLLSPHAGAPIARRRRPLSSASVLALLAMVALLALFPVPAQAAPPRTVTITDTTGSVDRADLEDDLSSLDFRTEVDLVVLVLDVTDHGHSADEDAALNDSVLAHARSTDPALLTPDGQYFADGAVIIALDPDNRFLGTYAGEDVTLDESGFESVQDAMRDDAQDADWEAALLAGAEKYADLLLRPWWQHPGILVGALLALATAVVGVLSLLGLRSAARRRMDEALPRYQDVLAKRALTDAAARTLPANSPYAQAVLLEHESYREKITEAERLHAQLPAPSQRSWGWGLRSAQRILARDVESTVGYLDETDDDILAAGDLLHRIGDWRTAWERELQPLRDSVGRLEEVLAETETSSPATEDAVATLRALGPRITTELDALTAQLEGDALPPDAALERLDALTEQLSAAITALQEAQVDALAADSTEESVLRDVEVFPEDHDAPEYRSLRQRRHDLEVTSGVRGAGTSWQLNPVLWYSLWSSESSSELESHRNPDTSSGSTSGFSGGFSGAGSSSRF